MRGGCNAADDVIRLAETDKTRRSAAAAALALLQLTGLSVFAETNAR